MNRLTTSNLIHFAPGAGDGGRDESDPVSRFELSLATRLDGVTQWSRASGYGLSTELLIEFGANTPCDRLRLTGITPIGHAPLVLPSASYRGSTICYTGPGSGSPLVLYADDPLPTPPSLAIGFPNANLFPYFQWPSGVFTFDPPLQPGEVTPAYALELESFDGLNPEAEPSGVRLPMRLIAIRSDTTEEIEVATLTDLDAPGFTGSGTRVTCALPESIPAPPGGAVWSVSGPALGALVPESFDGPITLDLYWRIYHGSGDMVYRAICNDAARSGQTYRDRRDAGLGGGFGTFATTSVRVATIQLAPVPYPFLIHGQQPLNVNPDGAARYITTDYRWGRSWCGDDGLVLNLVDTDPPSVLVGMSARSLTSATDPVLCACLAQEVIPGSPANPPSRRTIVRALCTDLTLYHIRLDTGARRAVGIVPALPSVDYPAREIDGVVVQPAKVLTPLPTAAEFSQDGLHIILHSAAIFKHPTMQKTAFYPGVVWELMLEETLDSESEETVVICGPWMEIYRDPDASGDVQLPVPSTSESPVNSECGASLNDSWESHASHDQVMDIVIGAGYRHGQRVIRLMRLRDVYMLVDSGTRSMSGGCCGGMLHVTQQRTNTHSEVRTQTLEIIDLQHDHAKNRTNEYLVFKYKFYDLTYELNTAASLTASQPGAPPELGEGGCLALLKQLLRDYWYLEESTSEQSVTITTHYPRVTRGLDSPVARLGVRVYTDIDGVARETDDRTAAFLKNNYGLSDEPETWLEFQHPTIATADLAATSLVLGGDGSFTFQLAGLARSLLEGNHNTSARILSAQSGDLSTQSGDGAWLTWIGINRDHNVVISGGGVFDATQDAAIAVDFPRDNVGLALISRRITCAPDPSDEPGEWEAPEVTADDLVQGINAYRAQRGLSILTVDSALTSAITAHVDWMRETNTLSHAGDGGSSPLDRARAAGFAGVAVGENLAAMHRSVDAVIAAWHGSPPHYANQIDPAWTSIGVSLVTHADGGYWWGVLFGTWG